jgi:transposase
MVAAFGPCRSTISFRFLPSITKMSPTRTVPCVASYAGMDITVHASDKRRAAGHRSRRGPPALRWALYEASLAARRKTSPDHGYYHQAADRLGGNRALLGVMRKLLKRSYHTLRELGDEAFAPA